MGRGELSFLPKTKRHGFVLSTSTLYTAWARIAESVQRLGTGWAVRGSNPDGGEIFRTFPDRPPRSTQSLVQWVRAVFPGGGKTTGASQMSFVLP
jgi:hypothetical protein